MDIKKGIENDDKSISFDSDSTPLMTKLFGDYDSFSLRELRSIVNPVNDPSSDDDNDNDEKLDTLIELQSSRSFFIDQSERAELELMEQIYKSAYKGKDNIVTKAAIKHEFLNVMNSSNKPKDEISNEVRSKHLLTKSKVLH